MNIGGLMLGLFMAFCLGAKAQECELFITGGRSFLAAEDIASAHTNFAEAVRLCPNHQSGRVLLAATRLLRLPNLPATEALLDRLGVNSTNRNLYLWTADLTRNTNGQVVFPPGVDADEIVRFVRNTVLPELEAAIADLSFATSPELLLSLTAEETHASEVTLDQGDVRMLRAALHFAQYLGYTLHACNLQAQLTDLTRLGNEDDLTIETFLAAYPSLLTFAHPADLLSAKDAVVQAAARYAEASELIRARPASTVRLFNLDPEKAEKELNFRTTLADLTNSLREATVLRTETNYVVHLGRLYDGTQPVRGFLPAFFGNRFILGTLPDVTFGGSVFGLTRGDVEEFLDGILENVPSLYPAPANSGFQGWMNLLRRRPYLLQGSDDLINWYDLWEFIATASSTPFQDPEATSRPQRYYRLVDMEGFAYVQGQVLDSCSLAPVAGAIVSTDLDERAAVTDANGNFFLLSRTQSEFPQFDYTVAARGYRIADGTHWGDSLTVYVEPRSVLPPVNDHFTNRTIMTGLPWTGSGTTCGATEEPEEFDGVGSVWWSWTATYSGEVVLLMDAVEYNTYASVYTGSALDNLEWISDGYGSELRFQAEAGTTYHFAVRTWDQGRHIALALTAAPVLELDTPQDGDVFSGPAILISGTATDPDGHIARIDVYGDYRLVATLTNSPFNYTWNASYGGYNEIRVEVTDNSGATTSSSRWFTIRPANDDFTNRTVLVGGTIQTDGTLEAATAEDDDPAIDPPYTGGPSVWYSWTAPVDGPATIAVYGAPLLGAYTGSAIDSLTLVATNAARDADGYYTYVSFTASAGTEYQILVLDYAFYSYAFFSLEILPTVAPLISITTPTNGAVRPIGVPFQIEATGSDADGDIVAVEFYDSWDFLGAVTNAPFTVTVRRDFATTMFLQARAIDNSGAVAYSDIIRVRVGLPNDDFANRIPLSGPLPLQINASNREASWEDLEPRHDGYFPQASVWWSWTSTVSGQVTISTIGSNFDTVLAIYTGTVLSSLSKVASDDQSGGADTSSVTFNATAGVAYSIAVDGYIGDTGNIVLNISSP